VDQVADDQHRPAVADQVELWAARWIVANARRKLDRRKAAELIARERVSLLKITEGRSPEECARRVLIPRLRGLEDSRCYWSTYMRLDHLRIVNEVVAHAIVELSSGRVPEGEASTATVKPRVDVGEEVIGAFIHSCDLLIEAEKSIKPTTARYAHPWFCPLDAEAWLVMAGFHMRLHHAQVDKIISRF
jgi:hypothetical protein